MSESTSTTTDREIHDEYDVVVVGAGNAGLVSALAAKDAGAKVLVLKAAPEAERGGNSRWLVSRPGPSARWTKSSPPRTSSAAGYS